MNTPISERPLAPKRWPFMPLAAGLLCASTASALTIPDTPLQAVTSAEPNLMMILDDSGSMQWEALPDEVVYVYYMFPRASGVYGGSDYTNFTVNSDAGNKYARFLRSSNNKVYYNPAILYTPWSKSDGSLWTRSLMSLPFSPLPLDPTNAPNNPALPAAGTRDLTVDTNATAYWLQNNGSFTGNVPRDYYPATYFSYNGGNAWSAGSYTKIEIRPGNAPFTKYPARTDCTGASCTYDEEMQNFTNWYSYYRSRVLTARAGIGRAFAVQGSKLRAGFGAINKGSTGVDDVNTKTIIRGVRLFSGADRAQFFEDLYTHPIPAAGTPLRRGLDNAGSYFSRTDDKGPWSTTPGTAGGTNLVCRQSYTILMTDGYWNDAAAENAGARANNDGTNGPANTYPAIAPFEQSYTYAAVSPYTDGRADTLADVAMYYWKNDLNTTLVNKVPTNFKDPAFWQHMVTFGVGLGVSGSQNAADAFAAVTSGATIDWKDPTVANAYKLDDLLHASINGHGGFFSAQDPQQFADALTKSLEDIVNRSGSAASVAANSTQLVSDAKIFNAKYDTSKWSGELEALPITVAGVAAVPAWKASEHIPPLPANRKIFTTSGGAAIPFLWASLSAADQGLLNNNSDVLDYIRGIRSKELQYGGPLRNRTNILGDIVHSSPAFVKDTDTVYVGANDGMLHAFNATTGVELFAYIPSPSLAKLYDLTQPSYSHKFFVDGDIAVSTTAQTPGHNYLVASLGRGGKGLFGLEVSSPGTFGATNVLWEYVGAADSDAGFMLGRPSIAKMNDGSTAVIIGNGYNSTNGNAVLYVFNLATGALIRKIDTGVGGDNGLAAPGVIDSDNDGDIDYIYAGDLKGNVWKFDVSSNNNSLWDSAFKLGLAAQPLFVARDASNNTQAITAPITITVNTLVGDPNYGKRFIFFGTGAFLDSDDPSDLQVQTWYGLIDEGTQITGRAALKQRDLLSDGVINGFPVRTFSQSVPNDMVGKNGWFIDLKLSGGPAEGERMVTASRYYKLAEPTLLASSIIPIVDPCIPGGKGYVNAVNPFTGARLSQGFFDLNGDGNFTNDGLSGVNVGSVDLGVGMPSEPIIVGNRLVVGGSGGNTGGVPVNTGAKKSGRLSWREILRN